MTINTREQPDERRSTTRRTRSWAALGAALVVTAGAHGAGILPTPGGDETRYGSLLVDDTEATPGQSITTAQFRNDDFADGLTGWATTNYVASQGAAQARIEGDGTAELLQEVDLTSLSEVSVAYDFNAPVADGAALFVVAYTSGEGTDLLPHLKNILKKGETGRAIVDVSSLAGQKVLLGLRVESLSSSATVNITSMKLVLS